MNTKPEGVGSKTTIYKRSAKTTPNTLHQLAFDHSLQPNIITLVSNGNIITANIAACELLGYAEEELVEQSRSIIFDIKESSFKKMLKQRTVEGQATALVKAVKKDGNILPCEITSAVFIDNGIEKAITTFVDISQSILKQKNIDAKKQKVVAADIIVAQTKSDVRLADNNEWIKYIAKTSYDVMWDWDIATGEIYVGDSIAEVLGYKVENNTLDLRNLRRCLLPGERSAVESRLFEVLASGSKSWKDTFGLKKQDGSVAITTCRASIVRDEDCKAIRMIGALQDISKLQDLEKKLDEQKDARQVSELPVDILWDWNILTNEACIGEGFQDLLGHTRHTNHNSQDWRNYLHADDKAATEIALQNAIESRDASWQHACRLTKADGSTASVFNRASIFRDDKDRAYRLVGIMRNLHPKKEDKSRNIGLLKDKKSKLIEDIKNVVLEVICYSHNKLTTNFSNYLSKILQYDYTYLANLFSEIEGMSIQQYIITQKIKCVKELIEINELTLTEIACKLQYSSVAHLSNQFKKITGLTPTQFKLNAK